MTLLRENIGSEIPSFEFEHQCNGTVAGVDEAGCGPWAGPVVAAAVILDRNNAPSGLDDSKRLSACQREAIYAQLVERAQIGIGQASVNEIDAINILRASLLAMRRAVDNLPVKPGHCLIDGRHPPHLDIPCTCLIKGDARSFSIAAASIVAKVTRDRIMAELAKEYPHYGWDKNAGYGVPAHKAALDLVGVSPHHRRSFAPIRELISEDSVVTN